MMQDRQVKRLWRALVLGKSLAQSADKSNIDDEALVATVAIGPTWANVDNETR
jgi:hypothetical protein